MNKTFVMLKPDAFIRGLDKKILQRIKAAGFNISAFKKRTLKIEEIKELYKKYKNAHFFNTNANFILSNDVGLLIVKGDGNVASKIKKIIGGKNPRKGTIRGDFGVTYPHIHKNLIHAASNATEAKREIKIFFR